MPPAVPNARVLSSEHGADVADRLATYVSGSLAREGAAAIDGAALVIDAPALPAAELAGALRGAGAIAFVDGERLVVSATRASLVLAQRGAGGAARALADELLRAFDADRRPPVRLRLRDLSLDLAERARVMGILNVTPNSFFDRGRYNDVDRARARAAEMVALGADVIDIGGQSYSSANAPVPAEEEAARVVPVVRALVRDGLGVPLSIDTFRAQVALAALDAGAHLINDCSGLSDPALAQTVARFDAALVVMHLKGRLNVRDASYEYDDAMGEILDYLRVRTEAALAAGVAPDAIVVDPGLEFGKEPQTDLEILRRFGDLRSLGYPVLFAASRKSFLGKVLGGTANELLVPSLATAALGIVSGAALVRVHDIAETVDLARTLALTGRTARSTA
jgi:dihydropteroate synthase